MKLSRIVLALLFTSAFAWPQSRPDGMFSRSATPIYDMLSTEAGKPKKVRIPAPDGRSVILASAVETRGLPGVRLRLRCGAKIVWEETFTPGVGIEAAWSPDSRAFHVTASGAGRNGIYESNVYLIDGDKVTKIEITPVIVSAFGPLSNCSFEEDPNVAGVKWLVPSKRLLVAAEIINHSNCDHYGTFRAYEISLPNVAVVRRYGQKKAKQLFRKDLGWELKDASDQCIRNTCR